MISATQPSGCAAAGAAAEASASVHAAPAQQLALLMPPPHAEEHARERVSAIAWPGGSPSPCRARRPRWDGAHADDNGDGDDDNDDDDDGSAHRLRPRAAVRVRIMQAPDTDTDTPNSAWCGVTRESSMHPHCSDTESDSSDDASDTRSSSSSSSSSAAHSSAQADELNELAAPMTWWRGGRRVRASPKRLAMLERAHSERNTEHRKRAIAGTPPLVASCALCGCIKPLTQLGLVAPPTQWTWYCPDCDTPDTPERKLHAARSAEFVALGGDQLGDSRWEE